MCLAVPLIFNLQFWEVFSLSTTFKATATVDRKSGHGLIEFCFFFSSLSSAPVVFRCRTWAWKKVSLLRTAPRVIISTEVLDWWTLFQSVDRLCATCLRWKQKLQNDKDPGRNSTGTASAQNWNPTYKRGFCVSLLEAWIWWRKHWSRWYSCAICSFESSLEHGIPLIDIGFLPVLYAPWDLVQLYTPKIRGGKGFFLSPLLGFFCFCVSCAPFKLVTSNEQRAKWACLQVEFCPLSEKEPACRANPTQTGDRGWCLNVQCSHPASFAERLWKHNTSINFCKTHQTFCDFSIFQVLNRLHLQDHRATLGQVIHVSWWVHRLNCNVFITSPGCRSQLLSLRRVLDFSAVWFGVWMHFWQVNDQFDALCSMGVIHQNVGWHRCGWPLMGMSSKSALQILSSL